MVSRTCSTHSTRWQDNGRGRTRLTDQQHHCRLLPLRSTRSFLFPFPRSSSPSSHPRPSSSSTCHPPHLPSSSRYSTLLSPPQTLHPSSRPLHPTLSATPLHPRPSPLPPRHPAPAPAPPPRSALSPSSAPRTGRRSRPYGPSNLHSCRTAAIPCSRPKTAPAPNASSPHRTASPSSGVGHARTVPAV